MLSFLLKSFRLAIPLLCLATSLSGQGWERAFGTPNADGLYDVINTPDGGNLSVGHSQTEISYQVFQHQLYLLKTDAGGFEDWNNKIAIPMSDAIGTSISETADGGYIIGGTSTEDGINNGLLVKTDHLGQYEWYVKSPMDSVFGRTALPLEDGSFMLVGTVYNGVDFDFYQMTVGANGNFKKELQYGGALKDDCHDAVLTPEGDIVMAGFTNSTGAGKYDVYLIKIDTAGNQIWAKAHGSPSAEMVYSIEAINNGQFIIAGQKETQSGFGEDVFIAKIGSSGELLWWKTIGKPGSQGAYDVKPGKMGGYVLSGYHQDGPNSNRQAVLLKTYVDGTLHWMHHFGGAGGETGFGVVEPSDSVFVMAGNTHSYGLGGKDAYLLKTSPTGITHSSRVMGQVYVNHNETCQPEETGDNIENILVEVVGDVTYFGTTDKNGVYDIPVAPGDYNIHLVNPSPLWTHCADSVNVTLTGNFDTAFVDFPLHPDTLCPYMRVDLSTLSMRQCFQNIYKVNYCNLGTVDADPAEVEVTFDPFLNIDSTSIPWTSKNGNTYTFDVGYLGVFQCGNFNVYFTVDCDSTFLGQTHCSEAVVLPNNFCVDSDPNWDEASIELDARCDGDSVMFTIQNLGLGDMQGPLGFIVIEEVLIGLQGDFDLKSGQDTVIVLPATGATYRMEADQSPGHPGNSKPCISVEDCGGVGFPSGVVVQYPTNDADPFVDVDCRPNTSSFDPNDKQGFPIGYGNEHFIEPNTDIEYLIRFQNTGTDTAFTVVIRDTLSPLLDPTSFEMGGASHAFRYELYDEGVLKFIFNEIMLPDSNVNEPASHGFVKFRIRQKADLPVGSVIENSAAIYFDFNKPIITNTTFHTIGENFIRTDVVGNADHYGSESLPWVHIYPNPFLEEATFELKNFPGSGYSFQLVDINGKTVVAADFKGKKFQFNKGDLPGGIYFYKILEEQVTLSSGKVIIR